MTQNSSSSIGPVAIVVISLGLAAYFCFAAIQGQYGVLQRATIEAEANALEAELTALNAEIAKLENKTRRLSDSFLDIDLLDQQARDVLGMIRSDEVVLK